MASVTSTDQQKQMLSCVHLATRFSFFFFFLFLGGQHLLISSVYAFNSDHGDSPHSFSKLRHDVIREVKSRPPSRSDTEK